MKSIANRLFLFAAAALSLGTVAYGQNTLSADVPFAFRMAGGPTAAGHYTVYLDSTASGKIVRINNQQAHRSALSLANRLDSYSNKAIAPRLVFRCAKAGCQLSEVWTPDGGYRLPVGRVHYDPEYTASIPLTYLRN
jgi:hypothetical protein